MKWKILIVLLGLCVTARYLIHRLQEQRKYREFAQKINLGLTDAINQGKEGWSIENLPPVDVLLISEGYVLTPENLATTRLLSPHLAKRLAANNADNDGTYLQLARGERVVAFLPLSLPVRLAPDRPFILMRSKRWIFFQFRFIGKKQLLSDITSGSAFQ